MAAIVALIVAVLPAFGAHVDPVPLPALGGQDDDCSAESVGYPSPLEDFRIENPQDGTFTDPETGAQFVLDVAGGDKSFDLKDSKGAAISAVVVKGGQKSVLYDFAVNAQGPITAHDGFVGPLKKEGRSQTFNVSHVSFCYELLVTDISGTVWHDNDQNGDIGDGIPNLPLLLAEPVESVLPRWTVNLYDADGFVASDETDGSGGYSFQDLFIGETFTVCEVRENLPDQWAQSAVAGGNWTVGACGNGDEEPDGHVITLTSLVNDADFGNFMTVTAGCGSDPLTLGGNTITFPSAGPLCDKDTEEYVFESYIRFDGADGEEQVVDFHPIDGDTGGKTAKLVEVFVFSINEIQNFTTLMYNDIIPIVAANDRVALYCNHDPRDPDTGLLDEDLVPPTMDVLPGPGTGGAEPDGSHTTCIIESVENADGSRTDTLYTEIDGRAWM
jgi:hypothetical protein